MSHEFNAYMSEFEICHCMNDLRMVPDSKEGENWYAIKTLPLKELKMKGVLDMRNVETYLPLTIRRFEVNGRVWMRKWPAVASLLFLRCTEQQVVDLQTEFGRREVFIYYDRDTHRPLIIPSDQMRIFMLVASSGEEGLEWLDPEQAALKAGDRVRVTGGFFSGAEGRLIRIRNRKRLLVTIEGVAAVATTYIPKCFIERL